MRQRCPICTRYDCTLHFPRCAPEPQTGGLDDFLKEYGRYNLKELIDVRDGLKTALRIEEQHYLECIAARKTKVEALKALITIKELQGKNNS